MADDRKFPELPHIHQSGGGYSRLIDHGLPRLVGGSKSKTANPTNKSVIMEQWPHEDGGTVVAKGVDSDYVDMFRMAPELLNMVEHIAACFDADGVFDPPDERGYAAIWDQCRDLIALAKGQHLTAKE
jgi:hypothetical protein|tara:strand:- start:151 stop:534 length:384 start_codon:yes stop_codon:yes gene_type:complete